MENSNLSILRVYEKEGCNYEGTFPIVKSMDNLLLLLLDNLGYIFENVFVWKWLY